VNNIEINTRIKNLKNCKNVKNYIIGKNSLGMLGDILQLRKRGSDSLVVFIIDEFFEDLDVERRLPIFKGKDIVIYASTKDEPQADYINLLADEIKEKCSANLPSAIVGMGGGTTMDIAKCISILLTNTGKAEDYQGWDLVKNPAIYKIGIPTISGTGSEVTRTAVLTSKIKKLGINSDHSVFDQVIYDSTLLHTVPTEQFIYTAMDCYVHCVESLRGSTNDAMTIALAQKSLDLLNEIFTGEMDYDKLMVASNFGGQAVANSNVGICHPLSYGLSLVLGLHHGYAICIAFNQLEEYYPEVKNFRKYIEKYQVKLPQNIVKNVPTDHLELMVDATLNNEKPLENAFGKDWKIIFSPSKVKELLLKM